MSLSSGALAHSSREAQDLAAKDFPATQTQPAEVTGAGGRSEGCVLLFLGSVLGSMGVEPFAGEWENYTGEINHTW